MEMCSAFCSTPTPAAHISCSDHEEKRVKVSQEKATLEMQTNKQIILKIIFGDMKSYENLQEHKLFFIHGLQAKISEDNLDT